MRRGRILTTLALLGCGRLDFEQAAPVSACSWDPRPTFLDVAPMAELNTLAGEGDPTLSADGLTIFYYDGEGLHLARRPARDAPFGPREDIPMSSPLPPAATGFFLADDDISALLAIDLATGGGNSDLHATARPDPSALFATPTAVTELNSPFHEFNPRMSPDGQLLIFLSWSGTIPSTARLYTARRQGGSWVDPQPVFPSSTVLETSGGFVGDSLHIVFGREQDLYMASRPSIGAPFGDPVPLDGAVNTSSLEMIPFASRDGCELLFVSDRPGGTGGWDLYRAIVEP